MSTGSDDFAGVMTEVQTRLSRGVEAFREYLASPEGKVLRQRVAQVLILTAPLLFRSKIFTRTWPGRILGLVGGAAIVVKLAEALRDWEPEPLDVAGRPT
jgi:hypothetical protein